MGLVRKAFSKNLAYHRGRLGLTQARLAEMVGTSPSYVGHLERGEREPSLLTIEEITQALRIGAGELFVEDRPQPDQQRAIAELQELLRDRSTEDIRLVIRLARAAFEDGRLDSEQRTTEYPPLVRRRGFTAKKP